MIQQSLLHHLASQYDLQRIHSIASLPQSKPFMRAWLALELSRPLADYFSDSDIDFAVPYHDKSGHLKYVSKSGLAEPCDRKHASIADLCLTSAHQCRWFEFHSLHQNHLTLARDRNKLYEDINRVRAMRLVMPDDEVFLFVAVWGHFNGKDIERYFKPLDNHRHCAYALDSSLVGSTQISRVSHMKREGAPRALLLAV